LSYVKLLILIKLIIKIYYILYSGFKPKFDAVDVKAFFYKLDQVREVEHRSTKTT
jgi:hypothetical protein